MRVHAGILPFPEEGFAGFVWHAGTEGGGLGGAGASWGGADGAHGRVRERDGRC